MNNIISKIKDFWGCYRAFSKFYSNYKDMAKSLHDTWRHNHRPIHEIYKKIVRALITTFSWELSDDRLVEVADILEAAKREHDCAQKTRDDEFKTRRRHEEEISRYQQDIARFESEVIHLKELVQEKNIVIDKLHQDLLKRDEQEVG